MTRIEIKNRIRKIRDELENRFKYGTIKLASKNGLPIPSPQLQDELYSLIYKLSKIE